MTECWCPSKIGVPHTSGALGCQSHKPRVITVEELRSINWRFSMTKITEYRLTWEMPDPWWAEKNAHIKNFMDCWDSIPWLSQPIEKVSQNFESLKNQWSTLRYWEITRTQPIRNVHLYTRTYEPTPWEEMKPSPPDSPIRHGDESTS